MSNSADRISIEALLAHQGWVRGLARKLLQDDYLAEEVVQDACVAALSKPAGEVRDIRSWLAGVVSNLSRDALKRKKKNTGSDAIEIDMAKFAPDPSEVYAEEAVRRRLIETVLSLDDPYRSTILLRYYREMTPKEIALLLGVPGETVRTRLHRGLQKLQAKLEQGGDERQLKKGLAILAGVDAKTSATKLAIAAARPTWPGLPASAVGSAAAVLLAAVAWLVALDAPPTAEAAEAAPAVAELSEQAAPAPPSPAPVRTDEPARVAVGSGQTAERAAEAPAPWVLRGQVQLGHTTTYDSPPAPHTPVRATVCRAAGFDSKPFRTLETVADSEGRFELQLEAPEQALELRIDPVAENSENEGTTVYAVPGAEAPDDVLLHVFPRDYELTVRVTHQGQPVPNATVWVIPEQLFTDRNGEVRFTLGSLRHERRLHVWADGLARYTKDYDDQLPGAELVLPVELQPGFVVRGIVVDQTGAPVAGVKIADPQMSRLSVQTDEQGRYALPHRGPRFNRVRASKRSFVPTGGHTVLNGSDGRIDLTLARGTRVRGWVVGSDGNPVPGATAYLGTTISGSSSALALHDGVFSFENMLVGEELRLTVLHPGHAPYSRWIRIPSGDVFDVRVPLERPHFAEGRVVDEDGLPVAGCAIYAAVPGTDEFPDLMATTAPDGEYRFEGLPNGGIELRFQAEGFEDAVLALPQAGQMDQRHPVTLQRSGPAAD
ncbi:MAG: sigma-70 family RNA polymerase sigma factor [Planctomycetota bacterium]